MFKIVKPEIDKKWSFREGMSISATTKFADDSDVLTRLKLEDPSPASLNYNETIKPKYKFTKYYLNLDKNEVITERVFYIEETRSWFGVTDWRHGTFHLYRKMLSRFPYIKKCNDSIGIFYRYNSNEMVVYSTDDCAAVENCVNWLFNNPDAVRGFMCDSMQMFMAYKEIPYLGPVKFFAGNQNEQTGLAIIDV